MKVLIEIDRTVVPYKASPSTKKNQTGKGTKDRDVHVDVNVNVNVFKKTTTLLNLQNMFRQKLLSSSVDRFTKR